MKVRKIRLRLWFCAIPRALFISSQRPPSTHRLRSMRNFFLHTHDVGYIEYTKYMNLVVVLFMLLLLIIDYSSYYVEVLRRPCGR